MVDLRATAGASTLALVAFASPAQLTQPVFRVLSVATGDSVRVPATPSGLAEASDLLVGIEGVDFGELTEADLAMLHHASATGAVDVDFSEFYVDDDE